MKYLTLALAIVVLCTTTADAQLLRWRRAQPCCPQQQQQQQKIVAIPLAPTVPEATTWGVQAPGPIPIPMPQPCPTPQQVNDCGVSLAQLMMLKTIMENRNEIDSDTESIKTMLMVRHSQNQQQPVLAQAQGHPEILAALVQALVERRDGQQPILAQAQSQGHPEILAALVQALAQRKCAPAPAPVVSTMSAPTSCEQLLQMLLMQKQAQSQ